MPGRSCHGHGAAGAKVVDGFNMRDGAAPVELTETTRVSVVARMSAHEIRHGFRATPAAWPTRISRPATVLLSSAGTQPYSRASLIFAARSVRQRSNVGTRGSAGLEKA